MAHRLDEFLRNKKFNIHHFRTMSLNHRLKLRYDLNNGKRKSGQMVAHISRRMVAYMSFVTIPNGCEKPYADSLLQKFTFPFCSLGAINQLLLPFKQRNRLVFLRLRKSYKLKLGFLAYLFGMVNYQLIVRFGFSPYF